MVKGSVLLLILIFGCGIVTLVFFESDRKKFDFELINKKDPGEKFNWA